MKISRLYMDNDFHNYCHLMVCEDTGEAVILDPLDVDKCLAEAQRLKCKITKIVNTHEHFDHIEGNPGVVAATGAKVCAHKNAVDTIPDVDVPLGAGDVVEVGTSVRLRVLDTPGHTMAHVCLVSEIGDPALFCGDTLFNAGCGHVHFGGNVEVLYSTFQKQLATLPDETLVYPGHDYIINNLNFSLSLNSKNRAAKELLTKVTQETPDTRTVTTMGIEKDVNPFLRLGDETIIETLSDRFEDLQKDPQSVFIAIRSLRNDW
jgi:hydroxyacylglutathione hydrolase